MPELFPAYFRLGLDEQIAPRAVVRALIAEAANPAALGQSLLKMMEERVPSGRTRASVMLEELSAQVDHFDAEHIGPVIEMLLDIGDDFGLEADQEGLGLINNSVRLTHLIGALLGRLSEEERLDILRRAVMAARSILLPTLTVHRLGKGLGVSEQGSIATTPKEALRLDDGLVGPEGLQELERLAAEKISERMQGGQLWGAPRFYYLVVKWSNWGGQSDIAAWLDRVRGDDDELGRFLVSASSTNKTKAGRFRLDPAWFDDFVSRDDLAEDVRRLQGNSPEPPVADACAQYLEELDHRQHGRDPENVYW